MSGAVAAGLLIWLCVALVVIDHLPDVFRHPTVSDPRWPSSIDAWRRDLDRIDADRRAHPERQS